jgi:hypothetical protein
MTTYATFIQVRYGLPRRRMCLPSHTGGTHAAFVSCTPTLQRGGLEVTP